MREEFHEVFRAKQRDGSRPKFNDPKSLLKNKLLMQKLQLLDRLNCLMTPSLQ